MLVNIMAKVTKEAKNLPFIQESLCKGWARIRLTVLRENSLFIASKPNITPNKGEKNIKKEAKEGKLSAGVTKSLRKTNSVGNCSKVLLRF
jgi:hypothetical protein